MGTDTAARNAALYRAVVAERDALRATTARLRAALAPLAAFLPVFLEYGPELYPDNHLLYTLEGKRLTVGDVRRAVAALAGEGADDGD